MRVISALAAGVVLSACASGMPDPVMLQSALVSGNSNQQATGSVAQTERSAASHVLSAVAIERVTGKPPDNSFRLSN